QRRRGADRRRVQAQCAQSRQPRALPELWRARDRTHQRTMRLLALPLRRKRRNARGRADQIAAGGCEESLPAEPGLSVRPVDPEGLEEMAGEAEARYPD